MHARTHAHTHTHIHTHTHTHTLSLSLSLSTTSLSTTSQCSPRPLSVNTLAECAGLVDLKHAALNLHNDAWPNEGAQPFQHQSTGRLAGRAST